jgi:hypothetical protein
MTIITPAKWKYYQIFQFVCAFFNGFSTLHRFDIKSELKTNRYEIPSLTWLSKLLPPHSVPIVVHYRCNNLVVILHTAVLDANESVRGYMFEVIYLFCKHVYAVPVTRKSHHVWWYFIGIFIRNDFFMFWLNTMQISFRWSAQIPNP